MSSGSSIPYRLRQNKAVDRELFLSLLGRLSAALQIEEYRYIGLGGPFLEDFRLLHARLGLIDMKCVEIEKDVHQRQCFNRPVECIECINSSLEDYIDSHDIDKHIIIWFDYTDPKKITEQIERFARTIASVPCNSILRITLNANPTSLGKPDNLRDDIIGYRLTRFKERLGSLCPSELHPRGMTFANYGKTLLSVLHLAVEKELLSISDKKVIWSLATHYADGQPMITATVVVCGLEDCNIPSLVENWEFYSTPQRPLTLDMPALSTLERLTLEKLTLEPTVDTKSRLGYELPRSEMGEDPFVSFKKFYRVFPHFSRVEL